MKKENALHPGNGWGKTSVIAKKHIYYILKHALESGYRTLNCAITQEQAVLVQDEICSLVDNSPVLRGWFIKKSVKFPVPKIVYFNNSVTEFKTTKKKVNPLKARNMVIFPLMKLLWNSILNLFAIKF